MKKINLIGKKFHKLTVISRNEDSDHYGSWKCLCECGNMTNVSSDKLKRKTSPTKSCGCLNKELSKLRGKNISKSIIKYDMIEASARSVWGKRYSEMPFEEFFKISQENCYYCQEPPSNKQNCASKLSSSERKKDGYFIYNGLDRLDNSKDHSKENCVPCCKYCNFAKRERSVKEFKNWIKKAFKNILKKI